MKRPSSIGSFAGRFAFLSGRVLALPLCLLLIVGAGRAPKVAKKRVPKPDEETLIAFWESAVPEQALLLKELPEGDDKTSQKILKQSAEKMALLQKYQRPDLLIYKDKLVEDVRRQSKVLLLALQYRQTEDPEEKDVVKEGLGRALTQALNDQVGSTQLDIIRNQGAVAIYEVRLSMWESSRDEIIHEFTRREVFGEPGWLSKTFRLERLAPGTFKSWQKGQDIVALECQLTEIAERLSQEPSPEVKAQHLSEAKTLIGQIYDAQLITVRAAVTSTATRLDQLQRTLKLLEGKRDELVELKLDQFLSGDLAMDLMAF